MAAVRAVLFDIGGVLEVNPRTGWMERWAARLGLDASEFGERLDELWSPGSVGGITLEEVERRTADAFDLDQSTLRALMEDAWAEYVGTLNEEIAAYFTSLRPRYRTGILSNSFVGAREREQALYGFEDMCDAIVYSHEVGCMKPDRRIYEIACERLGARPEEAVLLDDVQENVEGARSAGMQAIRFGGNAEAIAALEALLAA